MESSGQYCLKNLEIFENSLLGENPTYIVYDIADYEFWIDRLVKLPSIRPFILERVVDLIVEYCNNEVFRVKFLKEAIDNCPVLTYHLFKKGIYDFDEIKSLLDQGIGSKSIYYYYKEIKNFEEYLKKQQIPFRFEEAILQDMGSLDTLITYGYLPSTAEYCMKYDDYESFISILTKKVNSYEENAKWSPFEWSKKPEALDYLSFSGFFGSIHCFKHLLVNGYKLNDITSSIVVCSGNTDLFHLCNRENNEFSYHFLLSSSFAHMPILRFLFEKGGPVNMRNDDLESPLHYASGEGHLCVVKFLIENGAALDIQNNSGETPLHKAIFNGHHIIVELLLIHGASYSTVDQYEFFLIIISLLCFWHANVDS